MRQGSNFVKCLYFSVGAWRFYSIRQPSCGSRGHTRDTASTERRWSTHSTQNYHTGN